MTKYTLSSALGRTSRPLALGVLAVALTWLGCGEQGTYYLGSLPASSQLTTGLPCDVSTVLADNCLTCHGNPPVGASNTLVSYQELVAKSPIDPNVRMIDRVLTRVQDAARPMPPGGTLITAAELTVLKNWVAAGAPGGTCANQALTGSCTSGKNWTSGNRGSANMYPGRACISCHVSTGGEAPTFAFAGTVYPSLHEADSCLGVTAAAAITVEITDSTGKVTSVAVNSSGNFMYEPRSGSLQLPYTVKVKQGTKERAMIGAATSGDCNSCHTVRGANGAPGRILAP